MGELSHIFRNLLAVAGNLASGRTRDNWGPTPSGVKPPNNTAIPRGLRLATVKTAQAIIALCAAISTALTPVAATAADTLDLNLPSLGTAGSSALSPLEEQKLGAQLMTQVRADPTYLSDPELSEYLNRLGYTLVSRANTHTYNFFFFPIRDETLNAFALPGGFIAVHTGTIIAARNESELAGVMGHEIGHVTQRHIARMIEGQKSNLAITLGSVLLAILAARAGGNSGGHAAAAIAMGSQAAMIQSQLNYSQDAEREADRVGLQTLYAAGFDPKGMEGFFSRLQSSNRFYESAAHAYLSTHPLTVERMADMDNRTRNLPTRMHQDSDEFRLMQVRARVLQATSHDALMKLQKVLQDERKDATGKNACALEYGLSVVASRLKDFPTALRHAEASTACGMTSASLTRNLLRARFEATTSKSTREKILADARSAVDRFPLSPMMAENYVDLLYELDRHEELIRFLRNGTALPDTDPDYHAILARSYEKLGKKSLQYQHTGEMYALLGADEAAVYQYSLAQKANDGDFYTMSVIDARLRELREAVAQAKKDR